MDTVARHALHAISHPVLLLDEQGIIIYANAAMMAYVQKVTGRHWQPEQVVGLDVVTLHPASAHAGMRERLAAVVESPTPLPPRTNMVGETLFVTHDKVLRDEAGSFVCVMMEKIPVSLEPIP